MKDKYKREIDYLRLSVTDSCNLRCIYCMEENAQNFLESSNKLSDDEIIKIVKAASNLGIKKIRITGGEPLVRPNIVELIGKINGIEGIEEIYMTTNGILLADKVEKLVKNGLTGVNISLDSLNKDRFKQITRLGGFDQVMNAIDKSIEFGLKVKLNTVIVDEINDDEILDFVKLTLDKKIDVRFIELMPIGVGKVHKGLSNEEIRGIIKSNFNGIDEIGKDKKGGPAKYIKLENSLGKVGFISAMSNCFCEECNRIRVTPEGFLKQCLHFDYGVDLRDKIRAGVSDKELQDIIENTIYNKPEKHLFDKNDKDKELRFMNQIGG
ncbi:MAG: GTP 3',8-cyclase MoaA [Clostridium sp.]